MSGIPSNDQPESVPAAEQPAPPAADAAAAQAVPAAPDNVAPAAPLPPENVVRGFLLSLLAIPAGVLVYMIIWNLGFIASITGLVIAFAAFFLYRLGSGGRVSIRGGIIVAAVTLLTLAIAFVTGEVWDYVAYITSQTGMSWQDVLSTPGFAGFAYADLTSPGVIGAVLGDAALTFGFGILGCIGVIVNVFRSAKAETAPPVAPPAV